MTTDDPTKIRDKIFPGLHVEIVTRDNRSKRVKGTVKSILTHSPYHSHGIMVQLEDGWVGRVQKIFSDIPIDATAIPIEKQVIDIRDLIGNGENESVEYKSSALWSKSLTEYQMKAPTASRDIRNFGREASKVIIAKSIAGFLNTDGGHLIIGIKENKSKNPDEIIGIEGEFSKLQDQCSDGYRRMIVDEIIRKYFNPEIYNHFSDYIKISFPEIDGKILCWLQLQKSDVPVFLTIRNDDYFFIRMDAETRILEGKEMVEYCKKRF
ncbi:MAG: YwbE family protein [Prolixibacteraceae bacterium]|jgi:uncharacterized repeat protein (TIGR03833 family)|nr:YwbE family protein [Prolixibacteraceae bacterium]